MLRTVECVQNLKGGKKKQRPSWPFSWTSSSRCSSTLLSRSTPCLSYSWPSSSWKKKLCSVWCSCCTLATRGYWESGCHFPRGSADLIRRKSLDPDKKSQLIIPHFCRDLRLNTEPTFLAYYEQMKTMTWPNFLWYKYLFLNKPKTISIQPLNKNYTLLLAPFVGLCIRLLALSN